MFGFLRSKNAADPEPLPPPILVVDNAIESRHVDRGSTAPEKAADPLRTLPARAHVTQLILQCKRIGLHGAVEWWKLAELYHDWWPSMGVKPITKRQLLLELSKVLPKRRIILATPTGKARVTVYLVPDPRNANIITFRGKAKRPALRSSERAGRQAKAA